MKYMKTYKIFESLSTDELEDIKDICIELEDKGFKVHVSKMGLKYFIIYEEVVERLKEYLGDRIIYIHTYNVNSKGYGTWVPFNSNLSGVWRAIKITFRL